MALSDTKPSGQEAPGSSCPQENGQETGDGPSMDFLQIPSTASPPGFHQPSFRDNQFPSPSERGKRDSTVSISAYNLRPSSPAVFIDTPDGNRRELDDEDYKAKDVPASDSGESEIDFKSIKTVEDGGFLSYEPRAAEPPEEEARDPASTEEPAPEAQQSSVPSSPTQGPSRKPKRSSALSQHDLEGVGATFTPLQLGSTASTDELNSYLDSGQFLSSLEVSIWEALTKSAFDEKEFLPLSDLCAILNKETTRKLLGYTYPEWSPSLVDEYSRGICGPRLPSTGRRKLLALLIMINKTEYITQFVLAGVQDIHLPLELEWDKNSKTAHKFRIYKKDDNVLPNPLPCCHDWSINEMVSFKTNQLKMLAPYLNLPRDEIYFYKLSSDYVLPFTIYERKVKSGYGRVMKIKIHQGHHNFDTEPEVWGRDPFFALKALHSHEPEDFKKEVEVLQKFGGANKSHPHLIRLLLAFRYGDTHYLLFNWADGDLKHFWATYPRPYVTRTNARWVMKQCIGIAKALQKIHRATSDSWPKENDPSKDATHLTDADPNAKNYGRHGDIKPENILWFSKQHQLVITDFGLSRYHSSRSKSNNPNESLQGFSPTYRPPECDMHKNITQRYDIWALGCVFLEFISWFILGHDATVVNFADARIQDDKNWESWLQEDKFFNVVDDGEGHREAVVKKSVEQWFHRLHADARCPQFAHSVLDMIQKHLLVPDAKARMECGLVVQELQEIWKKCDTVADYWDRGSPRQPLGQPLARGLAEEFEPINGSQSDAETPHVSIPPLEYLDGSFPRPKAVGNVNGVGDGDNDDFAGEESPSQNERNLEPTSEPDFDAAAESKVPDADPEPKPQRLIFNAKDEPTAKILDREEEVTTTPVEPSHFFVGLALNAALPSVEPQPQPLAVGPENAEEKLGALGPREQESNVAATGSGLLPDAGRAISTAKEADLGPHSGPEIKDQSPQPESQDRNGIHEKTTGQTNGAAPRPQNGGQFGLSLPKEGVNGEQKHPSSMNSPLKEDSSSGSRGKPPGRMRRIWGRLKGAGSKLPCF